MFKRPELLFSRDFTNLTENKINFISKLLKIGNFESYRDV